MPIPTEDQLIKLCMTTRSAELNYLLDSSIRSFATLSDCYTFNGLTVPPALQTRLKSLHSAGAHSMAKNSIEVFLSSTGFTNPLLINYILYHVNQDAILQLCRVIIELIAIKSDSKEFWRETASAFTIRPKGLGLFIEFTAHLEYTVATFKVDPACKPLQSYTQFTLSYEVVPTHKNLECQKPRYTITGANSARFNAIFEGYFQQSLPPVLPFLGISGNFSGPKTLTALSRASSELTSAVSPNRHKRMFQRFF